MKGKKLNYNKNNRRETQQSYEIQINKLENQIEEKEETIIDLNDTIQTKNTTIQEKNERIRYLEKILDSYDYDYEY